MKNDEPEAMTLTERVNSAYGGLTESERKIVDVLRAAPSEIAVMSGLELSQRAGVSTASVSRLFRRLGYESHDAARQAARNLRAAGSILHLLEAGGTRHLPENRLQAHLFEEAQAMQSSLSALSVETVESIVAALCDARTIWCAGFRNSHVLAEYAATLLSAVRPDVFVLAHGGRSLAERLAGIQPEDVAIVFGMRRRLATFAPLCKALVATGARTVLVTDHSLSPFPKHQRPTWSLTCSIETAHPIDSFAGAFSIVRLLALETLRQRGEASRALLERVEGLHRSLGELE
jgi:DNA-binding MurR/RpiR family transcriptional regulator